ncbi:hypothetical protein B5M45_06225 [Mycobacterium simiae]|uniref:PKS/mFAS DH domain-containing protein n=2 Tax=Mycobacterium simiae TaxID=1784 RepID=A0A1X0YBS2_MYCSI|nr:hypothetical protein B5M45_06225 [Mycobacterium simiae]
MLDLSMSLESDLGIDSIKRVEILAAVQQRMPSVGEVDAAVLGAGATLRDVVDRLGGRASSSVAAPATVSEESAQSGLQSVVEPPLCGGGVARSDVDVDVAGAVLGVVADKTGYPVEMLDLSMSLESDLGIDSIKRVEILAAVQQRMPSVGEVDAAVLGAGATLRDVVDRLGGRASSSVAAPATVKSEISQPLPAVPRYEVRAVAAPPRGMRMPDLQNDSKVEIAGLPGLPVAEALAARLRNAGIESTVVAHVSPDAECVIQLAGLKSIGTSQDAIGINREVFADAQRVAANLRIRGGAFITVQDTGGTFGLIGDPGTRAWIGGIAALTKTAAQEWPAAHVKAIDLATHDRSAGVLADYIVDELLMGGPELEVGLGSAHGRVTVAVVEAEPVELSTRIGHRDVLIVTGGGRGITAASMVALARATRASFVLIGRSQLDEEPIAVRGLTTDADLKRALFESSRRRGIQPAPNDIARQMRRVKTVREIRQTMAAIEAAGSRVRYDSLDVRNAADVSALLAGIRSDFGPITGLIHGAGVIADATLDTTSAPRFDEVFGTKVHGLRALLDATAQDSLHTILLFSSVSARWGNAGQCDYAMANEVLNKVALAEQSRRGSACLVRALGWGPWDGGMVDDDIKARFRSRGVALIPPATGAQAFVANVLDTGAAGTEILVAEGVSTEHCPILPTRGRLAQVRAHRGRQPYLHDHRVREDVVLPVVQVLEWFVRMAHGCRPGQQIKHIHDLRVLRGVTLTNFDTSGDAFQIRCAPVEFQPGELVMELLDDTNAPRYSAVIQLRASPPGASFPELPDEGGGALDRSGCYTDCTLFHGPAFQALERIEASGASGAVATLYGLAERNWPDDRWLLDPLALDGALQVAFLWCLRHAGGRFLPMRVGDLWIHQQGPVTGKLRCELAVIEATDKYAHFDLRLTDANGAEVAELRRVEFYAYDPVAGATSSTSPRST